MTMSDKDKEWAAEKKANHTGSGGNSLSAFEVPDFDYKPENQGLFNWGTNGKYSSKLINEAGLYMAKMTLGSVVGEKNQSINMLVDTSARWTWAYSCDKSKNEFWKTHYCTYFDAQRTETLHDQGYAVSVQYAGGNESIAGEVYEEYMVPYGSDDQMRARMNMVIVDAPNDKMHSEYHPYSGVLGLSPIDDEAGPSFITNLYDQDKIQQKVFSFLPMTAGVEDEMENVKGQKKRPRLTFGGYQT